MTGLRALLAVLASVFAVASVVLVVLALRQLGQRARFKAWRREPATVTSVGFEARGADLGVLRVVFDVAGRSSTRLDIGEEERRVSERARLLERFAVGSRHEALLDPAGGPAVLVTGLASTPASLLFIAVVFLVPVGVLAGAVWWLGQPH